VLYHIILHCSILYCCIHLAGRERGDPDVCVVAGAIDPVDILYYIILYYINIKLYYIDVYNPPAVKGASQTCASSQVRLTPSSSLSTVRGSLPCQSVNTSYYFILYYITLYYIIHYLHITFISGRWQLVHGAGAAAASKCNHCIL
jgi:tetrahydromethanopterin S-methyltransferase subunit D